MNDDENSNEVTQADHIHSFGDGAVFGGAVGCVLQYTDSMSTVEGFGVALVAGLATGFGLSVAKGAAGIKYKEQKLTNIFGIGAGVIAASLALGGFSEESNEDVIGFVTPSLIEVEQGLSAGVPIAMIDDGETSVPVFAPSPV